MTDTNRKGLNILLAVLVAVAAWTYVVYNYDPMIDIKYNDIPIEFVGEDTLASKGYGIVSSNRDAIDVVLNQKRIDTGNLSADDISVTADVSEAVEGDNGISLSITSPEGTQVVETDSKSVSVNVEKADSTTVGIEVDYSDSEDIAAEPIVTDLSTNSATIVGAGSEISDVAKVVAYLSYSEVSTNVRNFTRELVAIDDNGEIVPHIVIYPSEVKFNAKVGYIKTVDLVVNVVDKSDDDYNREYTAPDSVVIKGPANVIEEINSIDTAEINISYLYEDQDLELAYILPEGVEISNLTPVGKLHVVVSKKETKTKTKTGGE